MRHLDQFLDKQIISISGEIIIKENICCKSKKRKNNGTENASSKKDMKKNFILQ